MRNHRRLRRALAAATAFAAIGACGGESGGPTGPSAPTPGVLVVRLAGPAAREGAVLLSIAGPDVPTEVTAAQSGVIAHARPAQGGTAVALFGAIATGELLRMRVPDVRAAAAYQATVREVAGEDNALRADLASYVATVAPATR
jgi:hypothetical protein